MQLHLADNSSKEAAGYPAKVQPAVITPNPNESLQTKAVWQYLSSMLVPQQQQHDNSNAYLNMYVFSTA